MSTDKQTIEKLNQLYHEIVETIKLANKDLLKSDALEVTIKKIKTELEQSIQGLDKEWQLKYEKTVPSSQKELPAGFVDKNTATNILQPYLELTNELLGQFPTYKPKYLPNTSGRCPHCSTTVRFESSRMTVSAGGLEASAPVMEQLSPVDDSEKILFLTFAKCPECSGLILTVATGKRGTLPGFIAEEEFLVWPIQSARPLPKEVKKQSPEIAADYQEAALVLNFSPKASAALSRRCLQALLREKGNAHQKSLSDQIAAVIPNLPSHISENVDAIRNIGNFAAHPIKNEASGQIVDVEPGEADWNLDVLDMLLDFYYVQQAKIKEKRDALNRKLKGANKPPMK